MRVWRRLLGVALLAWGSVGASCNDRECEPSESFCDTDGRAHYCKETQGAWGDPSHWEVTDCGGAGLCRVSAQIPFCILDPAKAPNCPVLQGVGCNADGQMACSDGFVTSWIRCDECEVGDGGLCAAALGACTGGTCPDGLVCRTETFYSGPAQQCWAPCDCKDEQTCPVCDGLGKEGMNPFVCLDGWCVQHL